MNKIVFFNHFHKGDLHTHKEFIRHIQTQLSDTKFEYLHNNAEKLTAELDIPLIGSTSDVDSTVGVRKILLCNNVPQSNQSFASDMREHILPFAEMYPDTHFICTNKFDTDGASNILFTEDIIGPVTDGDLQEISYLSTYCDVIVGKNSGPYVFCETYDNYMDDTKTFVSFNTKHPDYEDVHETMSKDLNIKCTYNAVPIFSNSLNEKDHENIMAALNGAFA